jgi:hypothetical protein
MFNRFCLALGMLAILSLPLHQPGVKSQEAMDSDCPAPTSEATTISHAYLYIEYNYADGDIGVHGYFDDHGWAELCVYDPSGQQILHVTPQAQLGDLTMAGIFFESREPELAELSIENLLALFPEGQYAIRGTNFDGTSLTGFATFTQAIPAAPVILAPAGLAEDEEGGREVLISSENLVVQWEPITSTIDGQPVEIVAYEVIITADDYAGEHGFYQPIFDVHVPADRTSLSVSAEFWQPNTLYEIEILAIEVTGNQTISLGFFTTPE